MKIKGIAKEDVINVVVKYLDNDVLDIDESILLETIFDKDELNDYEALIELVAILKEEVK